MIWRFENTLAALVLAALMPVSPSAYAEELADQPFPSASSEWAKMLGGKWYAEYDVALPNPIVIKKPAENGPKKCTNLLGVWAGTWFNGEMGTALTVHEVKRLGDDTCIARVALSSGVDNRYPLNKSWGTGSLNVPRLRTNLDATIRIVKQDGVRYGVLTVDNTVGTGQWEVSFQQTAFGDNLLQGIARSRGSTRRSDHEAWYKRVKIP